MKIVLSLPSGTSNLLGTVTVNADVTPAVQANSVKFFVDDVLKATDTSSPFSYAWDTTLVANGPHQLKGQAFFDRNQMQEAKVNVTVNNPVAPPPPPPTQGVPVNTVAPTITGTATEGQMLTVSLGTWTNSPTSYAKQWERCDSSGNNPVAISSAVGLTYTLVAADVGKTIRVVVTATNGVGASAPITSTQTAVVSGLAPSVPVLVTAPVITGALTEGSTLTISSGSWTNSPTSYTHQWERCDSAGANCFGDNSMLQTTYVLSSVDVGKTIRCWTTAINTTGNSTPYRTAPTAVVTGPNPPPTPPPPAGTVAITRLSQFVNPRFGATMVNRWCDQSNGNTPNANAYQDLSRTQYAWAAPVSGPSILEVNTIYGAGFLFKVAGSFMTVASGGQKSEVGDFDHFIKAGVVQKFHQRVMFPAAGNPTGFANGPDSVSGKSANTGWNLFWEIHDAGDALQWGVAVQSGSGGPAPCLYFATVGSWGWLGWWDSHQIQYDRWYDLLVEYKLSPGSDGYIKAWIDDVQLVNRTGPNMNTGQRPYLQLGSIYGPAVSGHYNEVYHADMWILG